MRNLDHDAGAVAGLGVGADRAAVFEILENAQAVGNDPVALDVVDVGDEADAAGIMLVAGIIEPVRGAGTFRRASPDPSSWPSLPLFGLNQAFRRHRF